MVRAAVCSHLRHWWSSLGCSPFRDIWGNLGTVRQCQLPVVGGKVTETIYNIGVLWIVLTFVGTLLFGPGAIVLGGLGTWLLLRKRERGASLDALRFTGLKLGALLGAICPGLFVLTISLFQGEWPNPLLWLRELLDPSNLRSIVAYELTGVVTGVTLGSAVAHRLARRGREDGQ